MKNKSQWIIFCSLVLLVFSSLDLPYAASQEKTEVNPLRKLLDEFAKLIEKSIQSSFTAGELKFLHTHSQFFIPQREKDQSRDESMREQAKLLAEWIVDGCGEVDASFPILNQIVSITQIDNRIDKTKELPLQVFKDTPAKQGGFNLLIWTRVDCQGGMEKLEFTGIFRIKTKQGEYGLARAFRALELHEGKWKTVKKDFQWIQKLP